MLHGVSTVSALVATWVNPISFFRGLSKSSPRRFFYLKVYSSLKSFSGTRRYDTQIIFQLPSIAFISSRPFSFHLETESSSKKNTSLDSSSSMITMFFLLHTIVPCCSSRFVHIGKQVSSWFGYTKSRVQYFIDQSSSFPSRSQCHARSFLPSGSQPLTLPSRHSRWA